MALVTSFAHTPFVTVLLPPIGYDDHHVTPHLHCCCYLVALPRFKMIPMQKLCGISSLAFTTAANHYFLYSTECMHLSPSIPFPPSLASAIPQQNPYNRSSFSQKHHNKHPLDEHSLTSQNAPSRVRPRPLVPAVARPPLSALTWRSVADSSP